MLKIIYTDTGIHLEILNVEHQQWIAQRIKFATSIGEQMVVSKQRATFPLPAPICEFPMVEPDLGNMTANTVTVDLCDLDYVEFGMDGYWLASHYDSNEGIFVCEQTERIESYLWQLWCSGDENCH
ncbi:MAG: hypothetical protein RLZZ135_706 [Cyanobacteriota bacterium]